MSFVWFSGSGKFKIKTLLLPSDTWDLDDTVDFNSINIKRIGRSPLNNVRNKIIVNHIIIGNITICFFPSKLNTSSKK